MRSPFFLAKLGLDSFSKRIDYFDLNFTFIQCRVPFAVSAFCTEIKTRDPVEGIDIVLVRLV